MAAQSFIFLRLVSAKKKKGAQHSEKSWVKESYCYYFMCIIYIAIVLRDFKQGLVSH